MRQIDSITFSRWAKDHKVFNELADLVDELSSTDQYQRISALFSINNLYELYRKQADNEYSMPDALMEVVSEVYRTEPINSMVYEEID